MDFSQAAVDLLRVAHLFCFAAGMGTGVYFDFQTLIKLKQPLTEQYVQNLTNLHPWICSAFGGLWITGMALIYVRTSFNISEFPPKLWLKIILMIFMIWNAHLINRFVIPTLKDNIGHPLISIPAMKMFIVTQIGIFSMYCWTSGLLLGASSVLKTANWELLVPLSITWYILLTVFGQLSLFLMCWRLSNR